MLLAPAVPTTVAQTTTTTLPPVATSIARHRGDRHPHHRTAATRARGSAARPGRSGATGRQHRDPQDRPGLPLFRGVNLATLDEGPGLWPGTATPGQLGNAVVAAHRVSHGGPFRKIDQLAPGDEVRFTVDGVTTTYVMVSDEVVVPEGIHIIEQTPAYTATLFACHPPGSTKFRYVVKLKLAGT